MTRGTTAGGRRRASALGDGCPFLPFGVGKLIALLDLLIGENLLSKDETLHAMNILREKTGFAVLLRRRCNWKMENILNRPALSWFATILDS